MRLAILLMFAAHCLHASAVEPQGTAASQVNQAPKNLPVLGAVKVTETRPSINVGQSCVGETIEGVYEVLNNTTAPLSIAKVTTSCGCSVLYPEDQDCEPGSRFRLIAKVTPKKPGNYGIGITIDFGPTSYLCYIKGKALK
ncbi:MAG: DUF1573 domain-containing protein [Phycisphaera sp. RhM]|nr:DUF1573 domain-containing protein [Phycisphaera sp. RhM]